MATTKIWSVKKRIDKAVNYVTNKQKTKNDCYEYGMDKYSEEIRLIYKYKLENMKDLRNLEYDKQEELQKVLNKRNSLYRKRNLEKDEAKKI